MSFWKSPRLNLTESEIRYAMRNSRNNTEAAQFLHISSLIYKKYASMYIDAVTGMNLYELHKVGRKHNTKKGRHRTTATEIIDGDGQYEITTKLLKQKLLEDGEMVDICGICGHSESRLHDGASPTLLVYLDGDRKNYKRENLKLVCYNCHYLYYGNLKPSTAYYSRTKRFNPRQNDVIKDENDEIDFSQY